MSSVSLTSINYFSLTAAAIHHLKLSRTHVDWHSVEEVYLYSDATTSKIARTVTQKLGFSKGLYHLHHTLSYKMDKVMYLCFIYKLVNMEG